MKLPIFGENMLLEDDKLLKKRSLQNLSLWLKLPIFGENMLLEDDKLLKDYFRSDKILCRMLPQTIHYINLQDAINLELDFFCCAFYIDIV